MKCLSPNCFFNSSSPITFNDWISDGSLNIQQRYKAQAEIFFNSITATGLSQLEFDKISNNKLKERLLDANPCFFRFLNIKPKGKHLTHFAELTLKSRINDLNIEKAFALSKPSNIKFNPSPNIAPNYKDITGDYCEALCSELLATFNVPHMELDPEGWPIWSAPAHLILNIGKFSKIKSYGDILIPAGPTNILISVKSVKARERLLMSGNRFESIGFGFFDSPEEFWSEYKINLLKRMGFTAIYMPMSTVNLIEQKLQQRGHTRLATNINGKNLFRPLKDFGKDIFSIAGKLTINL